MGNPSVIARDGNGSVWDRGPVRVGYGAIDASPEGLGPTQNCSRSKSKNESQKRRASKTILTGAHATFSKVRCSEHHPAGF